MSSVEDDEQLRQPLVRELHENVDYVKEFIFLNKRITICEDTNMLGISLWLVQRTMKDECSEKWDSGDWFLYPDNTSAHSALSLPQFLAKK